MPAFEGQAYLYLFQSFNALSFSIILGAPIVLFTTWLGGGSKSVGIVTSIMPFLTILQIPSTIYIGKLGYRRAMLAGWSTRTFVILGFVFLPFLKGRWSTASLIAFLCLCLFAWSFLRGMANASWLPWIRALVPDEKRGRFFAAESRYIQLMSLVILFLSGVILGSQPDKWRFSLLFLISFLFGMTSVIFLSRIPSKEVPQEEKHIPSPLKTIRQALQFKKFKRFLLYALVFTVANGGFDAFTVLFLKRESHFSERRILWLTACSSGGMILVLFFIGKFLDRWGSKPIMKICMSLMVSYQIVWFFMAQRFLAGNYIFLVFLYLVTGGIRAAIGIATTRLTMISVPKNAILMSLALYTTGTGVLSGFTPLFWGFVLDIVSAGWLQPFGYFFLGGILLNLLAFFLLRKVKESKTERTKKVVHSLLIQPVQALMQMMSFSPGNQNLSPETSGDQVLPDEADTSARNNDNCSSRS
ncbi:MFS transporter [Candidatus Sumerlaeota bacterium]|nr:MFS transporter [Candidatus Sumerlaeota bacterium]